MNEELKNILETFDKETLLYLEKHKDSIFSAMAAGEAIPMAIQVQLSEYVKQRNILIDAILGIQHNKKVLSELKDYLQ